MTAAEFQVAWQMCLSLAQLAQLVNRETIVKLIETADMGDAIGPILDPTAYRDGMGNLADQRTIANAVLNLHDAVEWVRDHPGQERRRP